MVECCGRRRRGSGSSIGVATLDGGIEVGTIRLFFFSLSLFLNRGLLHLCLGLLMQFVKEVKIGMLG